MGVHTPGLPIFRPTPRLLLHLVVVRFNFSANDEGSKFYVKITFCKWTSNWEIEWKLVIAKSLPLFHSAFWPRLYRNIKTEIIHFFIRKLWNNSKRRNCEIDIVAKNSPSQLKKRSFYNSKIEIIQRREFFILVFYIIIILYGLV